MIDIYFFVKAFMSTDYSSHQGKAVVVNLIDRYYLTILTEFTTDYIRTINKPQLALR